MKLDTNESLPNCKKKNPRQHVGGVGIAAESNGVAIKSSLSGGIDKESLGEMPSVNCTWGGINITKSAERSQDRIGSVQFFVRVVSL